MRTRILEGDDLRILVDVPGNPFEGRPDVVRRLGNAQVVAVEADDGRIVACWPIWVAVHLEPLWIAETQRGNPAVARSLVEGMRAQLQAEGITTAFAVIGYADVVTHAPMAGRLGFQRMPGDLFFLTLEEPEESNGSSSSTGDQSGRPVLHEPGEQPAQPGRALRGDDGPPRLGG